MLATPPRGRLRRAASALTLTLLLAVPALATAAPRMRLSATSVDFGRVAQQQVFKREVTIQNTGDAPLELSGVYTSCSCTEVSTRDTSVPPGGSTVLDVTFHSRDLSGENNKIIEINSNDPNQSLVELPLKAFVAAPILVEPSDRNLDFGTVNRGESPSLTATLKADGKPTLSATLDDDGDPSRRFGAALTPGGSADTAVLELRLKPDAIAGPFRQVLRVETGDARMPTLDFTVTGTILGDLTTSPGRVNFRFVKPGQELSKEIAVKPKAAALAFTVTGASVDLPGLSAEVLADGSGGDARVRISGTALAAEDSLAVASQGRLKSHLHIYTDRPEEPELQVDVLYMLR